MVVVTDSNIKIAPARSKVMSPEELMAFAQAKLPQTKASGLMLAFLMMDLRRSDRLSALIGDRSSQDLSDAILDRLDILLRPDDRIAVVTFDEIWLVLPDLTHPQLAVLAANRILDDRELRKFSVAGASRIRPCVGIACFPGHSADLRGLIEAADVARRSAAVSEHRYSVFQPAQAGPIADLRFQAELRDAINANALELQYQPQIDLQNGTCRSAEGLIRWPRAGGEPVSAARIAEVAESSDSLHSFTIFVVNTALRHIDGLRRGGLDVRLSINLSAKLVADDELPELIAQLLDAWNVPPAQLTLEMTESSIVKDVRRSTGILKELKGLGVRLAIDDFGTGYSSLGHLKLFPFDELKIDQLFVKNMLRGQSDLRLVRAMIYLGHNFGMEVVAEGVEDLPTLNRLKEHNCDLAQGYVIARPMTLQTFSEWCGSPHDFSLKR
jgi:EAL domain-containing protein (putative c-di-GMP-specific phosphodiesterase class I)/GGDEF domain-containing protein